MRENRHVTSGDPITIDNPMLERDIHRLARIWKVTPEVALRRALEAAIARAPG